MSEARNDLIDLIDEWLLDGGLPDEEVEPLKRCGPYLRRILGHRGRKKNEAVRP
jgi:hypothetical protein